MAQTDKTILEKFGATLSELRQKRNLSLRELAARCNIDHGHISKIEKGKLNPTVLTLVDLAQGLEVHPRRLMDFEVGE